jgi:hypothetical protein
MERSEVFDDHFNDLIVVDEAAGWDCIDELPWLWDRVLGESEA